MPIEGFPTRDDADAEPMHPSPLTWAGLLGQWVEFAQRALALPDDAPGQRMRDSVPDLIMLQALWFALQRIDQLEADERALGLDRAQLLIDKHTGALQQRFAGDEMPQLMRELIDDAHAELARHTDANS